MVEAVGIRIGRVPGTVELVEVGFVVWDPLLDCLPRWLEGSHGFDAEGFFGCAGVAQIPGLQKKLNVIGRTGYRHHVSMTFGLVAGAVKEAFSTYLGYTPTELDQS